MATTCRKYFISAQLPGSYEFANNNRQANFTLMQTVPGTHEALTPICFNSPSLDGHVIFPIETKITIKRARLVPSGGFGIHASPGKIAGKFFLDVVNENTDDGSFDAFDQVSLKFNDWGQWIDTDVILKPFKRMNTHESNRDATIVLLGVQTDYSKFYVDDYNLQSAYENETFYPVLEMEIESAGLWDTDAHTLF